jgi:hypothetical protein
MSDSLDDLMRYASLVALRPGTTGWLIWAYLDDGRRIFSHGETVNDACQSALDEVARLAPVVQNGRV